MPHRWPRPGGRSVQGVALIVGQRFASSVVEVPFEKFFHFSDSTCESTKSALIWLLFVCVPPFVPAEVGGTTTTAWLPIPFQIDATSILPA